jgi:hypothetical protein
LKFSELRKKWANREVYCPAIACEAHNTWPLWV